VASPLSIVVHPAQPLTLPFDFGAAEELRARARNMRVGGRIDIRPTSRSWVYALLTQPNPSRWTKVRVDRELALESVKIAIALCGAVLVGAFIASQKASVLAGI